MEEVEKKSLFLLSLSLYNRFERTRRTRTEIIPSSKIESSTPQFLFMIFKIKKIKNATSL